MKKKILCTLGPASLRPDVIREMDARQIDLFRINLSHTPIDQLDGIIAFVQGQTTTPLCIDTEGAQVRCGRMAPNVVVSAGSPVRLTPSDVEGTAAELTLRPASVFSDLRVGSLVGIDFDGVLLRVVHADHSGADAVAVDGGRIGSNKAVTVQPAPHLPALTDADLRAIEIAARRGDPSLCALVRQQRRRCRAVAKPGAARRLCHCEDRKPCRGARRGSDHPRCRRHSDRSRRSLA